MFDDTTSQRHDQPEIGDCKHEDFTVKIRRSIRVLLTAALLPLIGAAACAAQEDGKFDIILRNGTVFDGSGAPGVRADVGIKDGFIAAVGNLAHGAAAVDIDAAGLYVAPGFINFHDHSEPDALPTAENMLLQGVTTSMVNPDGGGSTDVAAQLAQYASRPLATNVGAAVGFNSVWESVVGQQDRRPTPGEITRMQNLIVGNLRKGAWNVSAGLDYKPGYYATVEEVVSVIKPAAPWRTSFPNHDRLRPETGFSSRLGMAETISIAEQAGVHPEITHMKVQGHEQGSADEALAMLTAATARGHYTPADVYPYLAGQTGLGALIIPGWALNGGRDAMLQRFKDPEQRAKIVHEAERAMDARFGGAKGVFVEDIRKQLTDVMQELHVSAGEAIVQLLERQDMAAILSFGREEDLQKILRYPAAAIACDCGASLRSGVHPRYFGTFPRVLGHYVREQKLLSWEDAVRKMTGLPATMLGMVDRGYLLPGMAADVTIFDPRTIIDRSTYERPTERPVGVRFVLVNGRLAVKDGKLTGQTAGHTLLRAAYMPSRPESGGSRSVRGEGAVASSGAVDGAAAGKDSTVKISFEASQAPADRRAHGSLSVVDEHGRVLIKTEALGLLQTSDLWASFTAYAADRNGGAAVTVVVDEANPLSPGVKNVYVLRDGKAAYEGTLVP
jgi:N-acyl-D-amino-acid deacylase